MKRWATLMLLMLAGVMTCAAQEHSVRVAVLGLFHPDHVDVDVPSSASIVLSRGSQRVTLSNGSSHRVAVFRAGNRVSTEVAGIRSVGEQLTLRPSAGGGDIYISVPGKLRRHYRGTVVISAIASELLICIEMDFETAVASVVAAELPDDTSVEALKAQAVVTRSFLSKGGHRHVVADFCDTTHCQFLREPPAAESGAARAARATRGEVLAWRGETFAAMYSASCGGRTRSLAESGGQAKDYPYFAVECEHCKRAPDKWSSRVDRKDADELTAKSEEGRIRAVRKLGWNTVPSNNFERFQDTDGSVLLGGVGRGHGIGLCQRGAAGMAAGGSDYRSILAHYFPNTTIRSIRERD